MSPRERSVVACGVFLIGLGLAILFVYGLPPLREANDWDANPTCNTITLCISRHIVFVEKDQNRNPINDVVGDIKLQSNYTFVVDQNFSYEIEMTTTRKDISEMMFIIGLDDDGFDKLISEEPNMAIHDAKVDRSFIITTKKDSGVFYAKGIWSSGSPEKLVLFGYMADQNMNIYPLDKTQELLTFKPKLDLEDAKRDLETSKSNKIFLGLTWIGVAVAPLLLGGDIIVRVILKEG